MKHKVGDKVQIVNSGLMTGFRGRVYSINSYATAPYQYGVKVYVGETPKYQAFAEDELKSLEHWRCDYCGWLNAPESDRCISTRCVDRRMATGAASKKKLDSDKVNDPNHYTMPNGMRVIDLIEHMNFNRGNAVKYIARAGRKDPSTELEDLKKARWYVNREIERLQKVTKNV